MARIISWNVFGGGKAGLVAEAVKTLSADVFVIIGCAAGRAALLADALAEVGLPFCEAAVPSEGFSTMIASRRPLRRVATASACPNPGLWMSAHVAGLELTVAGTYVPLSNRG